MILCSFSSIFFDAKGFSRERGLNGFEDIDKFNYEDKKYILYTINALIKNVKLKKI